VDTYFEGHVYGRSYDRNAKELSVFRLAVAGGKLETIYRRKVGYGRGGVPDDIGHLAVDADGVFFYDGYDGKVRKIRLDGGGEAEVLEKHLAFTPSVAVMGDFFFVSGSPRRKKGGAITWINDRDEIIKPRSIGGFDYWWSGPRIRQNDFEFQQDLSSLVVSQYLPGGSIKLHELKTRHGFSWGMAMGVDDDCVYYTATDWNNTWFYALPRTARLEPSKAR
jgi:hypothetical protein